MKQDKISSSVSFKILFIFILMIVPLNFLTVFLAENMIRTTVDQVTIAERDLLENQAAVLEDRMSNAGSLLYYFATQDANCLSMMREDTFGYSYQRSRLLLYFNLKKLFQLSSGADGYFYYFPKVEDIVVYGEAYIGRDNTMELVDYLKEDEAARGQWYIQEQNGEKQALLVVGFKDAICGAWICLDQLENDVAGRNGDVESEMWISDSYLNQKASESEKGKIIISAKAKSLTLSLALDRNEIIRENGIYQRLLFFMALVYFLLVPFLYLYIKWLFITPLNRINEAHRQLQSGNEEFRLQEQANSSEFTRVYQSFNQMADSLKELRIAAYEERLEKQQIKLRNLQLQIRPHFLQNTFHLIYVLVQRGEKESVKKIVLYLSDYFRYIFRYEKEMELFAKEKNLIEGYMQMVSFRYEGMVDFTEDVDPEIEIIRMPPLLIHNFIENAVKHGSKQGEILHITLEGRYDKGVVTFMILDDGNGMRKEDLLYYQKILRQEIEPENENTHLGLYNSIKRLKYFYGEKAEIELDSVEGEMTCFIIKFPYNLEVRDEDLHCE